MRVLACVLAIGPLLTAAVADACSCVRHATEAEADAAGEDVYRSADLIVEATVGEPPGTTGAICHARDNKPDPAWVGRRIANDRPLTIHRVVKGHAPARVILFENDLEVGADWCAARVSSCDSNVASGARLILLLRRIGDGRYRAESQCAYFTLRRSARGRWLYGPGAPAPL